MCVSPQLEELNAIPEKTEQDVASLTKKKDKLEAEKVKEEQKLAEVMESLKTETAGLQEEKGAKETELIDLQKAVNETKSKVSRDNSSLVLCSMEFGGSGQISVSNLKQLTITTLISTCLAVIRCDI